MATETKINGGEAATPAETTAIAERTETAPATRPSFEFNADDPVALYMNPGVFEMVQRVAKLMAAAEAVPVHLRGKVADCFLVAAQAFRWRMDPFAVAQHTFVVSGKLGYEGKLVAAVVNSHKSIEKKLKYTYAGAGADRKVIVTARLHGESEDRSIEGDLSKWKTSNENWTKDPDQMLSYRGARTWARRHAPEILLGVSTEEDLKETTILVPRGDGTFAAPDGGSSALDALTDRITDQAGAVRAASEPVEFAQTSEKEIPLEQEDTLAEATAAEKPAPAPEPDPKTPEGNPFLRGEQKARDSRKQRSLTE